MRKTFGIGKLSIDLVNEWKQFCAKGRYNWQEFHFLMIRMEKENIHGMFEIEFYLLGFGARFYWTWNQAMLEAKGKEYDKMLKESQWISLEDFEKDLEEQEEEEK